MDVTISSACFGKAFCGTVKYSFQDITSRVSTTISNLLGKILDPHRIVSHFAGFIVIPHEFSNKSKSLQFNCGRAIAGDHGYDFLCSSDANMLPDGVLPQLFMVLEKRLFKNENSYREAGITCFQHCLQEVEKDTVDMKLDFKNMLPRGEQEQREKGIPSDEEHRELDIEL
ncbi:hypothetical protein TRICI_004273 [Trichomonascus ciferrii]|uniref:Uncharacterized protein n=1 Tax=Trichomonascus ciferrii TaxID=44093 RepID=A0A642V1C6_9ASCO|nr:hypothetical protein TRICI_004273 [Trichomonascus ciferrii]